MEQSQQELKNLLLRLNQVLSLNNLNEKISDIIIEVMIKLEDVLWESKALKAS
jgi:hypothetical protein